MSPDFVIYQFQSKDKNRLKERFESFNEKQMKACLEFLRFCAENPSALDSRSAAKALGYWSDLY